MTLYLASKSPRRKELLALMGVEFEYLPLDVPEKTRPNETPANYSRRVTHEKLIAAWDKVVADGLKPMPVLCADTEVVHNQRILGKPQNDDEAFAMLKSYSNSSHEVITSVGLKFGDYENIITTTTIVYFSHISNDNIYQYLASGDYKGKSGGYGIQSYFGQFIKEISGCFYAVMGLPLNAVRELMLACEKAAVQN
jgi:septum formation protein